MNKRHGMKYRWKTVFFFILIIFAMSSCILIDTPDLSQEILVHIRIKNETNQYLDNYWLGSDGQHSFGDIKIDEITDYKSTGTHPSGYRKSSMYSNEQRYMNILLPFVREENESGGPKFVLLLDLDNSGKPKRIEKLEPGKYTFTISLDESGEPILSVFQDE